MKLSASLLKAIAVGTSVAALTASCHPDEVKSGEKAKHEKASKKQEETPSMHRDCPACGMG
ncbi:MAG TPA: hypothetical protein VK151_12675 [Fluviicola sp.]|nr:hypothetical protein [Fluviicola sp.]